MLKAEADNSYLYLDYSGLKKKLLLIIFMKFYKNSLKKNNQNIFYISLKLFSMMTIYRTVTRSLGTETLTTFC